MDLRGPVHRGAAVPLPASWREGGKDGESRQWLLLLLLLLVLVLVLLRVVHCSSCIAPASSSVAITILCRAYLPISPYAAAPCFTALSSYVSALTACPRPAAALILDCSLLFIWPPISKTRRFCSDLGELRISRLLVPTHRYQPIPRPPQVLSCGTHPPSPLRSPLDSLLGFGQRLAVCLREGREDSLYGSILVLHYQSPASDLRHSPSAMCDYTQVEYECGHLRFIVRAWCENYETTHRRCPPTVVAIEFRYVRDTSFSNPGSSSCSSL
jgi:hypothetical protein